MPMAAQRWSKPNGVPSFLADPLAEQRKARALDERLQMQATTAWAKEDAKAATRDRRERVRLEERAKREQEVAAGQAEAEAVTRALRARLTELETLLASTLEEDPYVAFEQLKNARRCRASRRPRNWRQFNRRRRKRFPAPAALCVRGLAPGRKRAHAAAVEQARDDYLQARAQHEQAEQARQELLVRAHAEHELAIMRERERIER